MLNEFLGDGPIPGSSFTEELGNPKWQKPPKISLPTEAFQHFIDVLSTGDNYDRTVFCMEEGLPIEGITNTIVNNMTASGLISYDIALLLTPEIGRVLEAVAKKAEIEYVMAIPRKVDTSFVEAQIKKIEEEEALSVSDSEEEVEEEPEEEIEEDEPQRKGLMGA